MNEHESGSRKPHRTRNVQPRHHDSYAREAKMAESQVCDTCGVVYHGGRWYWGAPPLGDVRGGPCPACRRIADRCPVGTLRLPRSFLQQRDEVVHLIRNLERSERDEHPLERVMGIDDDGGGLLVTTTGQHLARRIADRLERRFHSKPRIHYGDENTMRVEWDS